MGSRGRKQFLHSYAVHDMTPHEVMRNHVRREEARWRDMSRRGVLHEVG